MGTRYPGFPPWQADEVGNARGATALPAALDRDVPPPAAMTSTCTTPTDPLSKPKLTVPVWTPGGSAERSAAIEINELPGSSAPLDGDALSQPIPSEVKTTAE